MSANDTSIMDQYLGSDSDNDSYNDNDSDTGTDVESVISIESVLPYNVTEIYEDIDNLIDEYREHTYNEENKRKYMMCDIIRLQPTICCEIRKSVNNFYRINSVVPLCVFYNYSSIVVNNYLKDILLDETENVRYLCLVKTEVMNGIINVRSIHMSWLLNIQKRWKKIYSKFKMHIENMISPHDLRKIEEGFPYGILKTVKLKGLLIH